MPQPWRRFRRAGRAIEALAAGAALTLVLLSAAPAAAADASARIDTPWIRMIVPSRPAAGYMVLTNTGATPLALTGASSPGCAELQLHETMSQGGVEQMRPIGQIEVPAHGSVAFAPGGRHLMCMAPGPQVTAGGSVPVTLSFADGTTVTADFPVRNALGQ